MGNTTIIELNHDLAHQIETNKEEFIEQIQEQLRANVYEGQDILGGKVICFFHRHESPIEKAWNKFKVNFGKGYK